MAIDWNRLKFLATDGDKSIWTYATNHVGRDRLRFDADLPRYPKHELVSAKSGIAIIFHGGDIMELLVKPLREMAATFERIPDTIVREGNPVANQGSSNDKRTR